MSWEMRRMEQDFDGRGPDRLVTALEILLHPSRLVEFGELAA